MNQADALRQRRRDASVKRLRRTTQTITGGATVLMLAFVAIAARGFSGHSRAAAATTVNRLPTPAANAPRHGDRERSRSRTLARPATAPKRDVRRRHSHHVATAAVHQTTTSTTPSPTVSGGS